MANTYTQVYIQLVFAVEGRQSLIAGDHKEELYKYITGAFRNKKQTIIAINGMPDHIHILFGQTPTTALSDLVKEVKVASSDLVNEKKWVRGKFNWQEGFGGFSYSRSDLDRVAAYVRNQEKHHASRSFREEYLKLLELFEVEYNPKYVFKWLED
jgi:putative transposase